MEAEGRKPSGMDIVKRVAFKAVQRKPSGMDIVKRIAMEAEGRKPSGMEGRKPAVDLATRSFCLKPEGWHNDAQ